ncbi:MAG: phosphate ABC transporter substrate-binding protein PstS [Deltaproteobacteria bacterium]|nr:MAG: phosphate ABC transporter substrate-binding protein PstS [Deltaproteobacteria bacterium]
MRTPLAIFLSLILFFFATLSWAKGVELLGAGATFPYPLYSKMFYSYWKTEGIKVNYQPIGSGGGIRQLVNQTVDFGGSDAFMSDEALAAAPAEILHIPTCLGAVVLSYNLPGNPPLKLTPEVVADIFLGRIKRWNETRIEEINPDLKIPEMNIMVIHRSDGSGTTFVFTDYLAKTSKEWSEKVGRGKAVNWPVGLGAKGNPGVTGLIKHLPGAVGYTELGYALLNGLPVALLRNKYGRYIEPGPVSIGQAASVPLPGDTRISITNADAPLGYPMSSFTWLLIYREQAYKKRPFERATELVRLLWWVTHEAQKYTEPLHYGPLPEKAVKKAEGIIRSVTHNGKPVPQ